MKRIVTFLLIFFIMSFFSVSVYANDSSVSSSLKSQKIVINVKPDVKILLNGVKQEINDNSGSRVYPAIYEGSTYLPVRALAGLMGIPIEWDGSSKTVFIGKTLSNPSGTLSVLANESISQNDTVINNSASISQPVQAYLKPDVLIMYNFELQSFKDVNGKTVYPIIYNGTTYLPLRAISGMLGKTIEWDAVSKTVSILDKVADQPQDSKEPETKVSQGVKDLKSIFEREELLYYEATTKTTSLKAATKLEEKQKIASKISEDYENAQKITTEIKELDTSDFIDEQLKAYNATKEFVESTEYYVLVLENIAYLAAQDSDYSMLADTFLYFAMDSQTKMENARSALKALN